MLPVNVPPNVAASAAPVIVTVVARLTPGHKVPEQEQLLTAGSVCFALLQAAQALGFGAQWLTGWMAYDAAVADALGLQADEKIVGFRRDAQQIFYHVTDARVRQAFALSIDTQALIWVTHERTDPQP